MKSQSTYAIAGFALVLLLAPIGCGSEATLSTTGARDQSVGPTDAGLDVPLFDVDATDVEDDETTPTRSDFMEPCERDEDCLSGYCIQFGDGYVCSEFCTPGSCPDGWSCRVLENTGADAVRICVPDPDTLCSPCESNTDCGGRNNMCIDVGGHRVCGRDCTDDESVCPDGYFCSTRVDPAGAQGRQCVPTTEQCSCRPEVDGNDRPCVRTSQYGVCEGIEVCLGQDGWSACTANIPIAEICDGLDNDCDGLIDEDLAPRPCWSTPNAIGSCEGTESCQGSSGWVCDAPAASIEICDGLDNDCNGVVDDGLCYDGNPCTLDVCDPENPGGCNYPPRSGPCDDANLCTTNDRCIDGACVGSPVDCNDHNDCTADSCDPSVGCKNTNLSGTPCELGNYCTNDFCQDGTCVTGPAVQCGGSNACNTASCVPTIGCTINRLTGNPCNDGDPCTTGDVCSNGECIGGSPTCAGHTCTNCSGQSWGAGLDWCMAIGNTPVCMCVCF